MCILHCSYKNLLKVCCILVLVLYFLYWYCTSCTGSVLLVLVLYFLYWYCTSSTGSVLLVLVLYFFHFYYISCASTVLPVLLLYFSYSTPTILSLQTTVCFMTRCLCCCPPKCNTQTQNAAHISTLKYFPQCCPQILPTTVQQASYCPPQMPAVQQTRAQNAAHSGLINAQCSV